MHAKAWENPCMTKSRLPAPVLQIREEEPILSVPYGSAVAGCLHILFFDRVRLRDVCARGAHVPAFALQLRGDSARVPVPERFPLCAGACGRALPAHEPL